MLSKPRRIFRIGGFDIGVEPSWLIIAALITWSLSRHYFPQILPGEEPVVYLAMGFVAMLLFFGSLILHELAHSVVARRLGVSISGITLFVFGGVAQLESEPRSAGDEFWIAVAGPVTSLALSLGFWFAGLVARLAAGFEHTAVVLSYLATINLILALFNLVPAFPLDGGRILRAYLWKRSGNVLSATETASKSGVLFAYLLMAFGVLSLFQGAVVGGMWQLLIGGFILLAARSAYQNQASQVVFGNRTVADLMHRDPVTVDPDMMLADVINRVVLRNGLSFIPVVENGVLLGHIDQALLRSIDRANWTSTQVGDVFAGLGSGATVSPGMPANDLLKRIAETGRRKYMVIDKGELVGVISLSDLVRHLQLSDLVAARDQVRAAS